MEKKTSISLLNLLKGAFIYSLIAMSLFHVFFDDKSKEMLLASKDYKEKIKERDAFQLNLLLSLENDQITPKEYILKAKLGFASYKTELKTIIGYKRERAQEDSFRGRNSFKFWLYLFGLVTLSFFFSCKSLFDDISKGSSFRFHLISLTGVFVSCFWLIHLVFFTQKDFSNSSYIGLIAISAILSTIFTYFLIKYYNYKDEIIYNLISLVERIKKEHFKKVATKAMYSERNDKAMLSTDTVKQDLENFDKDVVETLKGI